ncbi:MAG: transcriptional coactivator p15/PC4 family protein [Hyphomicrobiaceae bacterium]
MTDFPITIAQWDRNAREVVRVALDQYNGRHTVNARVWYRDAEGGVKPTKTGITLSIKHLPALAAALAEAERSARNLGLIEDEAPESSHSPATGEE